jgi:hypothetical protein
MVGLAISPRDSIQFIDRRNDPPPSLEPRRIALVQEFVRAHRRMNGGIGSMELPHLLGSAPDV